MYTVRIDVLNPAQLDGVTPLNLATATRGSSDPAIKSLGLELVTVPVTDNFGVLDPGEVFGAQQIPLRLVSATVTPADAGTAFGAGDEIRMTAPGGQSERIVDLNRGAGVNNSLDLVIPIGYTLEFDATPGGSEGPYRLQLTFAQIQKPANRFGNLGA